VNVLRQSLYCDALLPLSVRNSEQYGKLGARKTDRAPERFAADCQPAKNLDEEVNHMSEGVVAIIDEQRRM
jgi:hypothetical protein